MSIEQMRKCPDPIQAGWMNFSDCERLKVRRLRDTLLKRYIEYKRGHLPLGNWKRRKRVRVFTILPERERPTVTLSPKNLELINFLDSLLNKEVQEDNGAWERLERTIDENRLSDRKFFT